MRACEALGIRPGITSVIGGGGKSTLLEVLAAELAPATVILCTTTHMFPPKSVRTLSGEDEAELAEAVKRERAVCVGWLAGDERLHPPRLSMAGLKALAESVIVEADGSRQLPLKAHAPYEPVVPPESGRTVWVIGLSGLGRPIREAAHRPERYAALAGVTVDDLVTPEIAARVVNAEGLCDVALLNQADDETWADAARAMSRYLNCPSVWGSLQRGIFRC